jgi:hypothetical protein
VKIRAIRVFSWLFSQKFFALRASPFLQPRAHPALDPAPKACHPLDSPPIKIKNPPVSGNFEFLNFTLNLGVCLQTHIAPTPAIA